MRKSPHSNPARRQAPGLAKWISTSGALLGVCLAQAGAFPAPSGALDAFVHQLESSYRNVRTLKAEFTETYTWGGRKRVESGTAYFARGGLMRWDYRQPKQKLFVSDGKNLVLFIPEENQMTRSRVKSSEDVRVPFRLLLSRFDLRKIFCRIEFADRALEGAPGDRVLRGVPKKGSEEEYREVLMEVSPSFDFRRLVVIFSDQSSMDFAFDRIERNVALSPALFRFTPPPGIEVIDQP